MVASFPAEEARMFAFGDQMEARAVNTTKQCKYGPTDERWPSDRAWDKLRRKLSPASALIATIPQASVCYGATTNDANCQQLTRNWTNSYTHIEDPTEVLSPIYQGLTCQPPTIYNSAACTLGGYPSCVVQAKTVSDIQSAVNFARNSNVRLVVKNTGHDFAGKSSGYGALSIWTHGLKDILYVDDYADESGYRGPVIKAGAGVQAFDLYKFASEKGVIAVAGEGQVS